MKKSITSIGMKRRIITLMYDYAKRAKEVGCIE